MFDPAEDNVPKTTFAYVIISFLTFPISLSFSFYSNILYLTIPSKETCYKVGS